MKYSLTFNADTSGVEKGITDLINFKDKVGIYSLSKTFKDELIWAYYAEGHKGYCIENDLELLKSKYFQIVKEILVDYKEKIPVLNDEDLKNKFEFFSQKLFGTKSKSWEHEKEIRLVFDNYGVKDYHPSALIGIFFGERMDDKNKALLISSLVDKDVTFYQVSKVSGYYSLKKELVHENRRNTSYRLDKSRYEIIKTKHNYPVVENFYVLIKKPFENKERMIEFVNKFKEEHSTMKCNVGLFDSSNVIPVIDKYPLNKKEEELYNKHHIYFSSFDEE